MDNRKVYMNYHNNLLQLEEHMYPLVDVDTPIFFLMMRFRRLRLTTVLCHIPCRMRSGSPIRHFGMDSSPVHRIRRSRS